MIARINEIPAAQDGTWGAVFAALHRLHRIDWRFGWTGHRVGKPDAYSEILIEAPGEDVDGMRAEILAAVDDVNRVVELDPLKRMTWVDPGLVEVLVS